jgi:hypothetical protein
MLCHFTPILFLIMAILLSTFEEDLHPHYMFGPLITSVYNNPTYNANYIPILTYNLNMKIWTIKCERQFKCHHVGQSLWLVNRMCYFILLYCMFWKLLNLVHMFKLKLNFILLKGCTSFKVFNTCHFNATSGNAFTFFFLLPSFFFKFLLFYMDLFIYLWIF